MISQNSDLRSCLSKCIRIAELKISFAVLIIFLHVVSFHDLSTKAHVCVISTVSSIDIICRCWIFYNNHQDGSLQQIINHAIYDNEYQIKSKNKNHTNMVVLTLITHACVPRAMELQWLVKMNSTALWI